MTTKQEIIEFIENKLQVVKLDKLGKFVINSEFASKELIQMIKDLKPRVKKPEAELIDIKNDEMIGWEYLGCKIIVNRKFNAENSLIAIIDNKEIPCFTLQKAQEACQKHYEETILGALED